MPPLHEAVLEWLAGERDGQQRHAMLTEITRIALHNKLWPEATLAQWDGAIDAMIKTGQVTERNGKLRIAPKPETKSDTKQMELF